MLLGIDANQLATGDLERKLGDFSGVFLLIGGGVDQLNLPLIVLFGAVECFLTGLDRRGVVFGCLGGFFIGIGLSLDRVTCRQDGNPVCFR